MQEHFELQWPECFCWGPFFTWQNHESEMALAHLCSQVRFFKAVEGWKIPNKVFSSSTVLEIQTYLPQQLVPIMSNAGYLWGMQKTLIVHEANWTMVLLRESDILQTKWEQFSRMDDALCVSLLV